MDTIKEIALKEIAQSMKEIVKILNRMDKRSITAYEKLEETAKEINEEFNKA
ncbi:MAG: hypothetical protein WC175_05510 [Candidatus Dojkabacteria bacterium]